MACFFYLTHRGPQFDPRGTTVIQLEVAATWGFWKQNAPLEMPATLLSDCYWALLSYQSYCILNLYTCAVLEDDAKLS